MDTSTPLRPVTQDEIGTFERDGVVVLRGILPARWVDRLEPSVAAAYDGDGTADLSALSDVDGGSTPRFRAGVDHWLQDPVLREFDCDSPLPQIAAALLRSEHVWLYEDSILVKPPGTTAETRFHADLPYFHVEGDRLATFWCPLDPVTPATGSLRFVRGSHRWDRTFRPNLFVIDEPIPGTEGERVPEIDSDDPAVLCVDLEPGDLTVHDARTLHGAGPNTSGTTWRRAVSVRYCGDGTVVRHRAGMPVPDHQTALVEGESLADGPATPQVWPRR
jgi:ectoine hydroxylase-related dioxygenase (phytanoyl-CoA dioxygenase family)